MLWWSLTIALGIILVPFVLGGIVLAGKIGVFGVKAAMALFEGLGNVVALGMAAVLNGCAWALRSRRRWRVVL